MSESASEFSAGARLSDEQEQACMTNAERFILVDTQSFEWPAHFQPSSKYFRLFVAADATGTPTEQISRFAAEALTNGMVYCCTWGPGCERVHDIVDETLVTSQVFGPGSFAPATHDDTLMTIWHDRDSLEDALEFFVCNSRPTVSYLDESSVWLILSVANPVWSAAVREHFKKLHKPLEEPH
jgi:hypothetical protein